MAHATFVAAPAPAVRHIERRQWLTLALVLGGSFMTVFDLFVVNVAIPTIQRDLHASFAQVQFVIAGYALAYAVTLITGGRLGDIYGRKRLFMLGMAGFTLTSALCGLAPGPWPLVGARILQGLAAAALAPQVLSIIQVTFPPTERGRALATFGAVVGFAATAGQVLGGLLIRADLLGLSWRPVFLVNLPVGVGVLVAARRLLAESRSATASRLDLGGVGILTVGLTLLTFPLVAGRAGPRGRGSACSPLSRSLSASWPSSAGKGLGTDRRWSSCGSFASGHSSRGCSSPFCSTSRAAGISFPSRSTSRSASTSPRSRRG